MVSNREQLIAHFQKGCKRSCLQKLGLEVEHLIVRKDTQEAVSYYGEDGIESILLEMADHFPHLQMHGEHLLGCYNDDYSVTLEPAAQLEISIAPRENIHSIWRIYQSFLDMLRPMLKRRGYEAVTLGYQPKSHIEDLKLIPKERYVFMDRYFREVDTLGPNMMRGTASTQISIDYTSEEDFVRKIRATYLLMPAIKLLTDNAPVFEGEAVEGRMMRTKIWYHVDPARCGIIPGLFDPDFGFSAYADYIWNLPLIFRPVGDEPVYTGEKKVCELWGDQPFTDDDIDHVLSMCFPDVRLKHYIEIRGADSMPPSYVLAYLALIKGIFFSARTIDAILERFADMREADILAAEASLIERGFDGEIYGMPAQEFLREMVDEACRALPDAESIFLQPFYEIIASEETLADSY